MRSKLKKVAVIGANGFIGSSLVNFLGNAGVQTIRFTSDQTLAVKGTSEVLFDDVSCVLWCASRVNPLSAETRSDLVNLELTEWKRFLDSWKKQYGSEKPVVFFSSGGCTYSGDGQPFQEDSIAEGINKYGELKVKMERELLASNMPALILRVANVYGPNQPHGRGNGVIAEWKEALKSGRDIKVFGSLESYRDYIFIEDLCEGVFRCLDSVGTSKILNLGGGKPIQLGTILNILHALKSKGTRIDFIEKRSSDRDGYYLDISKLKNLTNWQPGYSIDDGLRKTIVI